MDDGVRRAESDLALRFAREQGFFDKSGTVRVLIGMAFAIGLFVLLHFQEEHVENLELNSIAEKYIVAQVDFRFPDEESTDLHRQEAARDIGQIYRILPKQIVQRRTDFENYLNRNQEWRRQAEHSTFEEMYDAAGDLENYLSKIRFSDHRTVQKLRSMGISTRKMVVYAPPGDTVATLPESIWDLVQKSAFDSSRYHTGTVEYLLTQFRGKEWEVQEDIVERHNRRKIVQSRVPVKETQVRAGDRIIDHGEKATRRHLAMLNAMKHALREERNLLDPMTVLGSVMMTVLIVGLCALYFRAYHPDILHSSKMLFLLTLIIMLLLSLAKVSEHFLLTATPNILDIVRYPLLAPLAAILFCTLFTPRIAFFVTGLLTLLLMMTLAVDRQGFFLLNMATAMVVILDSGSLRQRKEIFTVCFKANVVCVLFLVSLHFYEGSWATWSVLTDVLGSALFMVMTAVLAVGLLPLLESLFQILSDVALMEYMDPNNELLRRLSIEASGTYQHSIVMGNLSESAAVAIGANGLFCRAATLYHDVGKLVTPHYFTENQLGGMNMHQLLTPVESAQVIIAHVGEGVSMARKIGLPEQFIDVIKEHHGTTLAYFFYHKAVEQADGDKSMVNEEDFRYAGPKPRSKESAIIMVADTFEAASRSLEDPDEAELTQLIDKIVSGKARDGQFDECRLTFEELGIVKKAMVKTLVAARHSRVRYPPKPEDDE